MTKYFLFLVAAMLFYGCEPESEQDFEDGGITHSDDDYLMFGTFYGFCAGEQCIEIFQLNTTTIAEDTLDNYNFNQGYEGAFVTLADSSFQKMAHWTLSIPDTLQELSGTSFGQPDWSDGGGLYLEQYQGGVKKFWILDQMKSNLSPALHEVVDQINEGVGLLQ